LKAVFEEVDYVKTDLMPDFDFDAFNHDNYDNEGEEEGVVAAPAEIVSAPVTAAPVAETVSTVTNAASTEEVDKW